MNTTRVARLHGQGDVRLRDEPIPCLFALPDALSDEDGAMLEPLGVAIHAVDLAHLKPGMTVGVYDCDTIGLPIAQVARLSDARSLVTHRFPLEQVSQAFAVTARREGIKVMMKC